jgi:hypothetical protein
MDAFPTIGRDDMHDEKTTETAATAVMYMRVNPYPKIDPLARFDAENIEELLQRQRTRCREVAQQHGLTITHEYADMTGAVRLNQRPELRRLLDELASRRAQYVIVGDIARLSRSAREVVAIEQRLTAVGATLLVWGENEVHAHLRRRMAALLVGDAAHEQAGRKERGA